MVKLDRMQGLSAIPTQGRKFGNLNGKEATAEIILKTEKELKE